MPKTMDGLDPSKRTSGGADLIFQSSDGVKFPVHRKNVQCMAGEFPIPEATGSAATIQLPEAADVLEAVFQFTSPKRFPSLNDKDFDLLMKIAETVEKYEVFSAMHVCASALMNLRSRPAHAAEILAYALKHDYPQLADSVAEDLLFLEVINTVEKLPSEHLLLWLKYHKAARKAIFGQAEERIWTMPTRPTCIKSSYDDGYRCICSGCRDAFSQWTRHLVGTSSKSRLMDEILGFSCYNLHSDSFRKCTCLANRCMHLPEVAGLIKSGLEQIPSFTDFRRGLDQQKEED